MGGYCKERFRCRKIVEKRIKEGIPIEVMAKGRDFVVAYGRTISYGVKLQARVMCQERGIDWRK